LSTEQVPVPAGTCKGGGFNGGICAKVPKGSRTVADKTKIGRENLCTIEFLPEMILGG